MGLRALIGHLQGGGASRDCARKGIREVFERNLAICLRLRLTLVELPSDLERLNHAFHVVRNIVFRWHETDGGVLSWRQGENNILIFTR